MADLANNYRIVPAKTDEDVEAAATIIAQAFSALPVCEWLVPDAQERIAVLADVFAIDVAHALRFGTVFLLNQTLEDDDDRDEDREGTDDGGAGGSGVAVWVHRTRSVPDPPNYRSRLQAITGENYAQFFILDMMLEKLHPAGPHHHLEFLAVSPGHQGNGIGSALLDHYHAILDALGLPAYLEASSKKSARLYERHGYLPIDDPFPVGPDAVFSPMWREPGTGRPA